MLKLEAIYPEVIEKIRAEYAEKIANEPEEIRKKALEIQCESDVAEEIGRQRGEAIAKGGPLGERIKAENDALLEEMKKTMSPEMLKAVEEAERKRDELRKMMSED